MKAMILREIALIHTSPLEESEVADPEPGPGEVRLKICCCAICRTDLHVIEGDLPPQKLPIVPGHQVVGVVDAVGSGCRHWAIGQRVGVAWLRQTCGRCCFCGAGRENLCESARFTGYHFDGATPHNRLPAERGQPRAARSEERPDSRNRRPDRRIGRERRVS